MPRALKVPFSPSTEPTKDRRLTLSRSAGDLSALASAVSTETPHNPKDRHLRQSKSTFFIHQNGKERKIKRGSGDELKENEHPFCWGVLPNPQDSIVCGELYRLSSFGVWCRLWMELRLSYMFFYYNRNDSIPLDVIQLKNYRLVPRAPECDHLEGLFPFKIVSEEEQKIIFLYAESKECCVMWIAALYRACAQKPSRVIEGLNLARKNPLVNGTKANNFSITNKNVKNSWLSFVKQLKTDEDSELINSLSPLDHSNQTLEALHRCESAIRNTYDRALEMTEHEFIRRNIYFNQRRISTQIKVQTLEKQMQTKTNEENDLLRLNALQEHLESIKSEFEEINRAAEQTFQELETKKAEKLKRLHSAYPSSCQSPLPSDDDTQQRITYIANEPTNTETVVKRRKKRVGPGAFRPKTFSPGDWARTPGNSENPLTALVVEGLRKAESVNDLGVDHERHSKRRGPLQKLSRKVRDLKRTKSVENLSPISTVSFSPSPPTSPKSPSAKRENIGRRLLRSISHQETHSHPHEYSKSSVFYSDEISPSTSPKTKAKPVFSIGTENSETVDGTPVVTKTDPEGDEELIYHFQQNNADKSRDQTQARHHHGTKVGKKILRILSLKGRKKEHDLSVP